MEKLFPFLKQSQELEKGKKLLESGRFKEAISYFSQVLTKAPKDKWACYYLAEAYYNIGEKEKVKETLLKIVHCKPDEKIISQICQLSGRKKIVSDRYNNSHPCFSLDSKKIVFSSSRRPTNNNGEINNLDNRGIYIIDVDGKNELQIIEDTYDNCFPSFSPDSEKILFLSRRQDTNNDGKIDSLDGYGIYIFDLIKKNLHRLVEERNYVKHPSFSPDGQKILYLSWRDCNNAGIYIRNQRNQSEEELVEGRYENTFPSFSPSGEKIVYASWRRDTNGDRKIDIRDNSGIYVLDLSTQEETLLVTDKYNNLFPAFSPDGKSILYLSRRKDTNGDGKIDSTDNCGIYMIDIETKQEKELVSDKYYNKFASFLPDGKRIVYLSNRTDSWGKKGYFGQKGVYILDLSNQKERQLVGEKYFGSKFPVVSPDGTKIAYLSWRWNSNRGLYIADIDRFPEVSELEKIIKEM